eukprot:gnl/MRDRNA2_/MRDRNA2_78554_c0_seq1.p1 gnl/MRDRNA2_/MRDRNA2_78554_c0~~gnl/MRDRNA2_/MRDRNA2_78554_c0_seq1.p1  ORF type:complete len:107 (+),score=13.01 gnl/MRDRNA2_/MRDRNA2_78554_c0_seq1:221-541(+)
MGTLRAFATYLQATFICHQTVHPCHRGPMVCALASVCQVVLELASRSVAAHAWQRVKSMMYSSQGLQPRYASFMYAATGGPTAACMTALTVLRSPPRQESRTVKVA